MNQELPMESRKASVASIIVEGRVRRDMGDIESLMESMSTLRLMNPITVTPKRELIAGGRRLEAAKRLGWANIPVNVVDNVDDATHLLMERDENTCRKEMTHSERMDLARRLEALEKPKAEERHGKAVSDANRRRAHEAPDGAQWEKPTSHYKVSSVIGPAVGLSPRQYERARAVHNAAASPVPEVAEVAREAVEKLDSGEMTYPAAERALQDAKRAAKKGAEEVEVKETPQTIGRSTKTGPSAFPPDVQSIQRVAAGLHGYSLGLDRITGNGDLDESVTKEEATALHGDLSRAMKSIKNTIALLEKRKQS